MIAIESLEFREPIWLLLALLAPLVFVLSRRTQGHLIFSTHLALPPVSRSWRQQFSWLPAVLFSLATLAFAVSAAGPRKGDKDTEQRREGIAIMMVVDTSGSMRALDLSSRSKEETRLDVVKTMFEQFVLGEGDLPGRRNDSIGLIRFAGFADTASPLTLDHSSLAGVARTIELVEEQAEDGTAIGDALALAVSRIQDSPAKSKVIILLTDGVNNKGLETPLGAAELAKTAGVKVYAIGAGDKGMAPVRVTDPFTGRSVLRSMPVDIDEDTLKEVANRTEGQYFRAYDKESLSKIYLEIDRLERTELRQFISAVY